MDKNHIINRIFSMRKDIEKNLKNKGYVIPKRTPNGDIEIGVFTITKDRRGFYKITDTTSFCVASGINLPQTAIIMANNMALGHWTDKQILDADRRYGHYAFDEYLSKRRFKTSMTSKDYDKAGIMDEKYKIARMRKDYYKRLIDARFDKLLSLT